MMRRRIEDWSVDYPSASRNPDHPEALQSISEMETTWRQSRLGTGTIGATFVMATCWDPALVLIASMPT